MTIVEWWEDVFTGGRHVTVNGCMAVFVPLFKARSAQEFADLLVERVTPCIWLAMPGHEAGA